MGPEHRLQASCIEFVRTLCLPTVKIVGSMNGMYLGQMRSDKGKAAYIEKMKKLGMEPGEPDLRLHWRYSECFEYPPYTGLIELKAPGKKPSKEQLQRLDEYLALGCFASWTDNIDHFVTILKDWRVPMKRAQYNASTGPIQLGL